MPAHDFVVARRKQREPPPAPRPGLERGLDIALAQRPVVEIEIAQHEFPPALAGGTGERGAHAVGECHAALEAAGRQRPLTGQGLRKIHGNLLAAALAGGPRRR